MLSSEWSGTKTNLLFNADEKKEHVEIRHDILFYRY